MNWIGITSSYSYQRQSKKTKTLNKWKRWRLPTPNTRKNCRSCMKKSYNSSRSSYKYWLKTNCRCKASKKNRSWTWPSNMRRQSTLYYRNLRKTCRGFNSSTKLVSASLINWRWTMRRSSLCRKRSRTMRLRGMGRNEALRSTSLKLLSTSSRTIWRHSDGRRNVWKRKSNFLKGKWKLRSRQPKLTIKPSCNKEIKSRF